MKQQSVGRRQCGQSLVRSRKAGGARELAPDKNNHGAAVRGSKRRSFPVAWPRTTPSSSPTPNTQEREATRVKKHRRQGVSD